jgi:lysozyme
MLSQQLSELQIDEGKRLKVYDDATGRPIGPGTLVRGHPTIGFGRALDVHGINEIEALFLLVLDVAAVEDVLTKAFPWYDALDTVRQGVLINLCFNLGFRGLQSFTHMLADVSAQNWEAAASELENSLWIHQVQASRSDRLLGQLRTGTVEGEATPMSIALDVTLSLDPVSLGLLRQMQSDIASMRQEIAAMSGTTNTIASEIERLRQNVADQGTEIQGAVTFINGVPGLIAAAIAQAQAAGATPEQLAAFDDLNNQLVTQRDSLHGAVAANTPSAGGTTDTGAGGGAPDTGGTATPAGP